jgi:hypothetical protein
MMSFCIRGQSRRLWNMDEETAIAQHAERLRRVAAAWLD